MTQIERIEHMERILNEATEAVQTLQAVLARYRKLKSCIAELEAYYTSPQWMKDYEDDEAGRLPVGLKRGVLSQDAVDSLLHADRVLQEMLKTEQ